MGSTAMLAYLLRQLPPPSKNNAFSDDKEISKELDAATKALFLAFKDKELIEKLRNLPESSKKEILSDISSKLLYEPVGKPLSSLSQAGISVCYGQLKEEKGFGYPTKVRRGYFYSPKDSVGRTIDSYGNSSGSPIRDIDEESTFNTKSNFIPCYEVYDIEYVCAPIFYTLDPSGPLHSKPVKWSLSPKGVVYINDNNEKTLYEFNDQERTEIENLGDFDNFLEGEDILKSFVSKKLKEEGNFAEAEKIDKCRNELNELVRSGNMDEAVYLLKKYSDESKNGTVNIDCRYSDALSMFNYLLDNGRDDETLLLFRVIPGFVFKLWKSGQEETVVKIYTKHIEQSRQKWEEKEQENLRQGLECEAFCDENLNEFDLKRMYEYLYQQGRINEATFIAEANHPKLEGIFDFLYSAEDAQEATKLAKTYVKKGILLPIDDIRMMWMYKYLSEKDRIDEAVDIVALGPTDSINEVLKEFYYSNNDEDMESAMKLANLALKRKVSPLDGLYLKKGSRYLFSKGRKDEILKLLEQDKVVKRDVIDSLCSGAKDDDFETAIFLMTSGEPVVLKYLDNVLEICDYLLSKDRKDEAINIMLGQMEFCRSYIHARVENKSFESAVEYENHVANIFDKCGISYSLDVRDRIKIYEYLRREDKDKEAVEILMRDPKALSNVITDLFDKKKLRELASLLKTIKDINK